MHRTLEITIACADNTCQYGFRSHCLRLGWRRLGQIPICKLFGGMDLKMDDKKRIVRCSACLAAERK